MSQPTDTSTSTGDVRTTPSNNEVSTNTNTTTLDSESTSSLSSTTSSTTPNSKSRFLSACTSWTTSPWYLSNRGWLFVLLSEFFGASMGAIARVMESDRANAMHPMQIICVRMSITFVLSMLYMYVRATQGFPFGPVEVRWLLVVRGITGFVGLFIFYWSLLYLPLAEATVVTFLVPIMIPCACAVIFHERIPSSVGVAGLVSFAGVIVIAKPAFIFGKKKIEAEGIWMLEQVGGGGSGSPDSTIRTLAVLALIFSTFTATASYTIVRVIGYRAHALVSVNYYGFISTVGSTVFLLLAPDVGFRLPADTRQWLLLTALGISGFALQFLLTAGLQADKSAVATSMMYSQEVFALVFDKVIWGVVPDWISIAGGALVLGSTFYVAVWGKMTKKEEKVDEERPLLGERTEEENEIVRTEVRERVPAANVVDE